MSALDIAIFERDRVTSTSGVATELLASGEVSVPFAVTALEQSSGRGRMGKTWVSPIGNLYLTLALPVLLAEDEPATLLPTKVATLLSWWLAVQHNLRVTIKWPNDLLFAGRKLGGILCETTVNSQGKCEYILAGIGINVNVLPEIKDGLRPTSVKEITGKPLDIASLRSSVIRFFAQHWSGSQLSDVREDFKHFAIEAGQLWKSGKGLDSLYRSDSLDEKGALILHHLDGGGHIELNTATEEYRWLYSVAGKTQQPFVCADVGNTSIKLAYYENIDDSKPSSFVAATTQSEINEWAKKIKTGLILLGLSEKTSWPLHFISTNDENVSLLKNSVEGSFSCLHIPHRPIRYEGQYNVSLMGQDRLAAIEAVLAKPLSNPTIVASIGSALTTDFLTSDGEHLGGWIGAGQQMQLDILGEAADALPHLGAEAIDSLPSNTPFGLKTTQAMFLGVRESIAGTISRARLVLARHLSVKSSLVDIVATGASAAIFCDSVENYRHEPHLVVEGLRNMVRGGSLEAGP